jgi:hypothetical protein
MKTCILKPDGRPDQLILDGLDCPQLYSESERTLRRRSLLARFENSPNTESAFYLAFNALSWNDLAFLEAAFGVEDDWALFRRLCREYRVREA